MAGAAFVLTGGHSSRMGRDKALLPFRGATLVEWVAGQALAAAGSVSLVGAPERYTHLGFPCLPESYPGCGPLSGIEAALRLGGMEWSLILACDMPGLHQDLLRGLLSAAFSSPADVVAAQHPSGRPEPLCAVYRSRVLGSVQASLEHGQFAVHQVLRHLELVLYPIDSELLLRNVNTSEEWIGCSR